MKTKKETRGRKPKDGVAKSAATRSLELRERDAIAIAIARTPKDFESFSDRLIIKAIAEAMKYGHQKTARMISEEIIKRAHPDVAIPKLENGN